MIWTWIYEAAQTQTLQDTQIYKDWSTKNH